MRPCGKTCLYVEMPCKVFRLSTAVLAPMFPGTISGLCRIALGDEKQGQVLTAMAVDAIASLVLLVAADELHPVLLKEDAPTSKDALSMMRALATKGRSQSPEQPSASTGNHGTPSHPYPSVSLDLAWIKSTASALNPLLTKVLGTCGSHPKARVRQSVASLAGSLLVHCSRFLQCGSVLHVLIGSVAALVYDEDERVALAAQSLVVTIKREYMTEQALYERLDEAILQLPGVVRGSISELAKVRLANMISGYMSLLSPEGLTRYLQSPGRLPRIATAMFLCVELLPDSLKAIEQRAALHPLAMAPPAPAPVPTPNSALALATTSPALAKYELDTEDSMDTFLINHDQSDSQSQPQSPLAATTNSNAVADEYRHNLLAAASAPSQSPEPSTLTSEPFLPQKRFRHFSSESVRTALVRISQVMTVRSDPRLCLLLHHLSSVLADPSASHVHISAAYLLRQCLSPSPSQSVPTDVCESLMHAILESSLWTLPTSRPGPGPGAGPGVSIETLSHNAVLVSLLVECVGAAADVLGAQTGLTLMWLLYHLLDKLGEGTAVVSNAAQWALWHVSRACGATDVSQLILRNTDYLVDTLCYNMRHSRFNLSAPSVLESVVRHTGTAIVPLMEDTLQALFDTLELQSSSSAAYNPLRMCFMALLTLVNAVSSTYQTHPPLQPPKCSHIPDLIKRARRLDNARGSRSGSGIQDEEPPAGNCNGEDNEGPKGPDDIKRWFEEYHQKKAEAEEAEAEEGKGDKEAEEGNGMQQEDGKGEEEEEEKEKKKPKTTTKEEKKPVKSKDKAEEAKSSSKGKKEEHSSKSAKGKKAVEEDNDSDRDSSSPPRKKKTPEPKAGATKKSRAREASDDEAEKAESDEDSPRAKKTPSKKAKTESSSTTPPRRATRSSKAHEEEEEEDEQPAAKKRGRPSASEKTSEKKKPTSSSKGGKKKAPASSDED
mmetsp:Transcript_13185/g.21642  ORF Transcript_13185/g.21642 Transcript_13185/m.21642 type:complete len:948 (-) Transcript_13185:892-3735(-)